MLTITHDIDPFATGMLAAGGLMQSELQIANQRIVTQGTVIAQLTAPRQDDILADSIEQIGAVTAEGGEFGTSVIYAWIQEVGGTIYGNPFLYLQRDGVIFAVARSVTIPGQHYMARTVRELEPFAMAQWDLAVIRVWDGV